MGSMGTPRLAARWRLVLGHCCCRTLDINTHAPSLLNNAASRRLNNTSKLHVYAYEYLRTLQQSIDGTTVRCGRPSLSAAL